MVDKPLKKIVIIGNGMVGHKFCEKIIGKTGQYRLVVFGEEPWIAYDRVHLSEYFAGKTADDLSLSSLSWYHDNGITLHLGDPVKEINRLERTVHSYSGLIEKYDYLII